MLITAALVLSGLLAGVFFAFSVAVMPGLRRASDGTFVETMQQINRAILNPLFGIVFAGSPLVGVLAAVVAPTGWRIAAAALSVATLLVTFVVNIPLNNGLDRATQASPARRVFERRWVAWNDVRTLLSVATLACLAV